MRTHVLGALLVVLPALSGAARGQTYTIKLRTEQDVGRAVRTHNTQETKGTSKLFDAEGKLLREDKQDQSGEEVYTETVLERGDKRPRKFKRTYEKAVRRQGPAAAAPLSYQGRTVHFELKGDRYEVRAEGEPALDKKDIEMLAAQANDQTAADLEQVFVTGKPVKAGDAWPVDGKTLQGLFGKTGTLDLPRCKGEARLVRAYEKDGKQFGVLEVTLRVAYKAMPKLTFEPPALFDVRVRLDTAIDGSTHAAVSSMSARLAGKGGFEEKGMKFSVEMSNEVRGKVTRSEGK
jgi:hypothetical protein